MTETTQKRHVERLLAVSTLYRALALLFRHPAREHRELLKTQTFREWRFTAQVVGGASLTAAIEQLTLVLEQMTFEEWIKEHENIFGHSAHGAAPPYELEYGEEHSYRQPQELGDIAAFYQAFGLRVAESAHERVDHVAVECDFLHFLALKEAYARERNEEEHARTCYEARLKFLRDHLGKWLPVFTLRVTKRAAHGLHDAIAHFAFAFVVAECQNLGVPSGPRDLSLRLLEEPEEVSCAGCTLGQLTQRGEPT